MEAGARVSGSRFAYMRGGIVLLEMALFRWALTLLREDGFEPVLPPVLVREQALYGTGFLPDTEQQIYALADDDLYLVGTSEVALASLHAGEAIEPPLRYAASRRASAARRARPAATRAASSASISSTRWRCSRSSRRRTPTPSTSGCSRWRSGSCRRSTSPTASSTSPSTTSAPPPPRSTTARHGCPARARYREVTSTSNTTDFQARRLGIRQAGGGMPATLNGTAVTWRHMIALLENHGGAIPEVLQEWGAPARVGNPS